MTIEKLKSGSYRITEMYHGKRYRKTLSYKPSKKEAERIIIGMIDSQDIPVTSDGTFAAAVDSYIELKRNLLSPTSICNYKSICRNLSEKFSRMRLFDITPLDVQKEINDYAADHSPKSTRNAHGLISTVLKTYRPSLVLNTTLPQKQKFEPYTPTDHDVQVILDAVSGTKYDIPFRLGCYGLRRSEICALTAADLAGNVVSVNKAYVLNDSRQWIIKPYNKTTDSMRDIYIDSDLADLIRGTQGRLFPLNPESLLLRLHVLQDRLGVPRFRFHDLRAYFASSAHALGIPDAYIMQAGGWVSPHVMQRIYRRAMEDKTRELGSVYTSHMSKVARG